MTGFGLYPYCPVQFTENSACVKTILYSAVLRYMTRRCVIHPELPLRW